MHKPTYPSFFYKNHNLTEDDFMEFQEAIECYLIPLDADEISGRDVPHGLLLKRGESIHEVFWDIRQDCKTHDSFIYRMRIFFQDLLPYEIYALWVYIDLSLGWYGCDQLFMKCIPYTDGSIDLPVVGDFSPPNA